MPERADRKGIREATNWYQLRRKWLSNLLADASSLPGIVSEAINPTRTRLKAKHSRGAKDRLGLVALFHPPKTWGQQSSRWAGEDMTKTCWRQRQAVLP